MGEDITLGGNTWEEAKASYNGAIETLNSEAEKYVNQEYAYDGRCVGSIPTIQNGKFINKNKVKDSEENIRDILDTVSIPEKYTIPTGWISRDTGCYNTDINCTIDRTALNEANMRLTGQYYWLASRFVDVYTSNVSFYVMREIESEYQDTYYMCYVRSNGDEGGCSYTRGLRPCISLKPNIIQITGGDGLSENTAYTIGR